MTERLIFFICMLLVLDLFIGCTLRDVHYKPDVIVAKLDKDIKKEIKRKKSPLAEDNKNVYPKLQPTPAFSASTESRLPLATGNKVDFGTYHALIIGINSYPYMKDLKTAKNDARTIAYVLKNDYGFMVKLMIDPNRSEIIFALGKLRQKLSGTDNLLIYYAGHGWLDEEANEGYWLPSDATKDNEVNWISNSTLTSSIRAMQAKHIMVVTDSCYSGKLIRGIHIKRKTPNYLSRISRKTARVVLTSGGLEPVIDSLGNEKHSIFASIFIRVLRENNGVIDGTELFSKVRRLVLLNSDQTPEYADIRKAGHDGGDFIFVKRR